MSLPSVSVIIPTHNRSDKLARALSSIGPVHEVIVFDDGSRSDEAASTAELVGQIPGATLIRQDQARGAPRARNLAASRASGDILAFLDSDDWWTPQRLVAHQRALAVNGQVLSFNRTRLTDRKTGRPSSRVLDNQAPMGLNPRLAIASVNFIGGCSSVCVKRAAFESVGGFDPEMPSCQDWDLWLRLSEVGQFTRVPEVSTIMDVGPHERITTNSSKVSSGHALMEHKALAITRSPQERRTVSAHHLLIQAEIAARFSKPASSIHFLFKSLGTSVTLRAILRLPFLTAKNLLNVSPARRS